MPRKTELILIDQIAPLIHEIRGEKVILDRDLAELYGVTTKVLNQAVRRNGERFPRDFKLVLTRKELASLRSQIVTSNTAGGRGGARYLPHAFTEHGAIMAATILNSPRAVEVSVFVVRAFVKMRQLVAGDKQIVAKLEELEQRVGEHDSAIRQLVGAIKQLMMPPEEDSKRRPIGFRAAGS